MRVLGYTWAGVRTSDLNSSSLFFSDILGLRRVHDGKGLVQFELPSGQLFEVFGSESRYYQFHNCPVVGFQVEDVRAAKQEMESKGIEFMTDVFGDDKEAWAYFRGPDGYLYEIYNWRNIAIAPKMPGRGDFWCNGLVDDNHLMHFSRRRLFFPRL